VVSAEGEVMFWRRPICWLWGHNVLREYTERQLVWGDIPLGVWSGVLSSKCKRCGADLDPLAEKGAK
jgi:hypothetical protein